MAVHSFEDLNKHVGHRIECVNYGSGYEYWDVVLECMNCNEVLVSYEHLTPTTPEERDFNNGYRQAEAEYRELKKKYGQ